MVVNELSRVSPLMTRVMAYLLTGINHEVWDISEPTIKLIVNDHEYLIGFTI